MSFWFRHQIHFFSKLTQISLKIYYNHYSRRIRYGYLNSASFEGQRLNPDALFSATQPIPFHALSAVAAVGLGAAQLTMRKGGSVHRLMGRLWLGLMALVATSSFFIHEINVGTVQSDSPAQSVDADFDRADDLFCPLWQH
jgi:hypothetical protein